MAYDFKPGSQDLINGYAHGMTPSNMTREEAIGTWNGLSPSARNAIAALLPCLVLCVPSAMALDPAQFGEDNAQSHAIVSERSVASPVGRVILVRQGDAVCGVRFLNAKRGHDRKPSGVFKSGEETMSAEYEWRYVESAADGLSSTPSKSGKGVARRGPSHGIGRVLLPSTTARIDCGAIERMGWLYPYSLGVDQDSKTRAFNRTYAPTAWPDFKSVNLDDPRLVWYPSLIGRGRVRIPIADLPGS